jgi:hypothetical protein
VRAIITFNQCTPAASNMQRSAESIGGINFNSFFEHPTVINGQQRLVVATADNILVHHEQYGTVFNRVQLRVLDDGSAEFTGEILDPKSYAQLFQASYTCHLSNGKDDNAVTLYNLS